MTRRFERTAVVSTVTIAAVSLLSAAVGRQGNTRRHTPVFTPPPSGYPRGYRVEVSMDGDSWSPVKEGAGSGVSTVIGFAPVRARFVRITQTAAAEGVPPWSIQRLRLFEGRN